jgi:hydroxymethylpyrimidine pyrophosphatase-like HAD family hydrolase
MNKAFVFDFDDTLATTDALTLVRTHVHGNVVGRLTPQQMNTHKLPPKCYYDFREFEDDTFVQQANPLWLLALVKEVHAEGHPVFILTARQHMVSDAIYVWLKKHGVEAATVCCVGGGEDTIPISKKRVLLDIVEKHDKVYFYDDSEENVNIFRHEKLRSYQV